MTVSVLVPVWNRPRNAQPFLASLLAVTPDVEVVFLVHRDDRFQRKTVEELARMHDQVRTVVMPFPLAPGDYARKINYGVNATESEWLFQAADDLLFHDRWLHEALREAGRGFRVVGTNDLGNYRVRSGRHSTHTLVHRSYIEEVGTVDEPGKMLHEGYFHNYVDDELVEAAAARREFKSARRSLVEHLHPFWRKADMGPTYERGLDRQRFEADRELFLHRKATVFGRADPGRRTR